MPENELLQQGKNAGSARNPLIAVFRSLPWLVLAAAICGAGLWLYSTYVIKPTYTSTARIYMYSTALSDTPGSQRPTISYTELYAAEQQSDLCIELLRGDKLLNRAIRSLHLDNVGADTLREGLSITADGNSAVTISLSREDPAEAQQILSRMLQYYPEELDRVVHTLSCEVINEASLPEKPSSPDVMRNTLRGACVGFLIAAAYVVIRSLANAAVTDELERR